MESVGMVLALFKTFFTKSDQSSFTLMVMAFDNFGSNLGLLIHGITRVPHPRKPDGGLTTCSQTVPACKLNRSLNIVSNRWENFVVVNYEPLIGRADF